MIGILVATIGYAILLAQEYVSVAAKYVALYLVVTGGYVTQPITLVWLANNLGGHYKRSIGTAMQIGFGNCGGILASIIFVAAEAPRYPTGYGVSLALLWLCAAACTGFFISLRRENRKRDRGERDHRLGLPKHELDNLGDDHPQFRFTY